ncbi:hypothetical protein PGT21_012149 [Puccinia graminis f. sp. tritici]|uniref:Uncharacterized protein n=1 Tax=Puccinia graminis f. sp. tritici TaxID=56615 RepID=A0A5B0QHZ1_PUCGR|nr:hypothetical protein PGT21_012149 [Puccinia graminis f. sp. tritici]
MTGPQIHFEFASGSLRSQKDFVEFLRWELYMRNSELIDRSPIRPSAESGSSANPEYPATGPDTRG